MERIEELKNKGLSYREISEKLNIPIGTIKTYFHRQSDKSHCLNCGKEIKSLPHKKQKKFCSDKCRLDWWSKNRDKLKLKTLVSFTCENCKKEFLAPRHTKRKYCCRECFAKGEVG